MRRHGSWQVEVLPSAHTEFGGKAEHPDEAFSGADQTGLTAAGMRE